MASETEEAMQLELVASAAIQTINKEEVVEVVEVVTGVVGDTTRSIQAEAGRWLCPGSGKSA